MTVHVVADLEVNGNCGMLEWEMDNLKVSFKGTATAKPLGDRCSM